MPKIMRVAPDNNAAFSQIRSHYMPPGQPEKPIKSCPQVVDVCYLSMHDNQMG